MENLDQPVTLRTFNDFRQETRKKFVHDKLFKRIIQGMADKVVFPEQII